MTDFNINDMVRVKLTDHGRAMHVANHKAFWASAGRFMPYTPPRETAEGWSEWQLWSLMVAFGQHIYMGGPLCFETTIQLVEPKPWPGLAESPMDAVRAICRSDSSGVAPT